MHPRRHLGIPLLFSDSALHTDADSLIYRQLERQFRSLLHRLRRFQKPHVGEVHYHAFLASALVRAIRLVKQIANMAREGVYDLALVMVRSLYELALVTNLDWLDPSTVGPLLILDARSHKNSINQAEKQVVRAHVSAGWSDAEANAFRKSWKRLMDDVRRTDLKAEVSPMRDIHTEVYRKLSSQAHQSLVAGADFLNEISVPSVFRKRQPKDKERARNVLLLTNVAAGLLYFCIDSDVGEVPKSAAA